MKLIVGLGNPDKEYLNTFHNLGFMAVDETAKLLDVEFTKTKCRAMIAETKINGEKVILAKPLTYMNLSGESVRELASFYKIALSDLLVIYDDVDIGKGVIRIRESGSAGTHNGMKNIIKELGQTKFARVRIGFKPDATSRIPLIDLVLSGISKEDKPLFDTAVAVAGKVGQEFALGEDIQKIMQKYNGASNQ
ncbi:MAG: aminoacyl-tRNA hydrolase [Clostridiales bacterium]|nr:aminoacyl-tRNA hydrolase [Clostridiales bacterium]